MLLSTCIFFVAPMALILILYLRIALVLHRSSRNGSLRRCCATQHLQYNYNNGSLNNGHALLNTPNQSYTNYGAKRCQAERAHIQSRRAVIRMLGKILCIMHCNGVSYVGEYDGKGKLVVFLGESGMLWPLVQMMMITGFCNLHVKEFSL